MKYLIKDKKKHYDRLVAIDKFVKDLNSTQQRIMKILKDRPWTRDYFNKTFMKDFNSTMEWFNKTYTKQEKTPHWEPEVLSPLILNIKMDNLRNHLYEMSIMKNLTEKEKAKEKEKKSKKKNKKFGDINLDDILNKKDNLDDLFKKYNISKEEFQKRILNDTINNKTKNTKDENKDKKENKSNDDKKESDL